MTLVRGLVPVLATPFDAAGGVDCDSLVRLLEFQLASGADAVAVFGMASEGFALGAEDKRLILETIRQTAPTTRVVAGVAAPGLAPAVDELRASAAQGVSTAMVMPPHMVKPSTAQVLDFFAAVGEEARGLGVDVMVQDAPGVTGVVIAPAELAAIAALDGIVSIKVEAPPTVAKIEQIRAASSDVMLLGGQNAQFVLDEYAFGAVGTMPACEFTDFLEPILAMWTRGEREAARADFARLLPLIVWGLQPGLAWSIHKEILVHRGIIETATVRSPARVVSRDIAHAAVEVYESVARELAHA